MVDQRVEPQEQEQQELEEALVDMEEPEPNPSTHEIQGEPADPQVESQPAVDIGQAEYDPD